MPIINKPELSKDPRKYLAENCAKRVSINSNVNKQALESDQGKSFIGGISKIGGLEIDSGITKGLSIFASASQSGGPALKKAIDGGANGVLDTVFSPLGFGSAEVNGTLNSINPDAVNTAIGSAKSIVTRLEARSLNPSDIPSYVRDFRSLGVVAANAFSIPSFASEEQNKDITCIPSPYALDIIKRGVKHKFMFILEFKYNAPYAASMGGLSHAFVVRNIQMPPVNIEHDEVNFYNYRTHIPKKVTYDPIEMTFYDDAKNDVMNFYASYLKITSPIANRRSGRALEQNSMNFDGLESSSIQTHKGPNATQPINDYAASIGPLSSQMMTGSNTIIDEVRIYHLYGAGGIMNVYRYFNPKITQMRLSDLDQTSSDATDVSVSMVYDFNLIHTNVSTNIAAGFDISNASSQGGALYPVLPFGDSDLHIDSIDQEI